ncbi:hypothetical protein LVD13_07325 [Flavobacteriaceae bacterium D16]|nr:hypothetical protein [Flavobacteriaceae bacterium D16]
MANPKNGFKYLTPEALTLGYIVLVCLGYLEKAIFYSRFGIEIWQYLNLQEYLLFFIPIGSSILVSVGFFTGFILTMIIVGRVLNYEVISSQDDKEVEHKPRAKKNWKTNIFQSKIIRIIRRVLVWVMFLVPLFLLALFVFTNHTDLIPGNFYSGTISIWAFILLLMGFVQTIVVKEGIESRSLITIGALVFVILVVYSIKSDLYEKIINGKPPQTIEIHTEDSLLKSDNVTVYLGKTTDYIFLRKLSENENIIVPMKEVKKMTIKDIEYQK